MASNSSPWIPKVSLSDKPWENNHICLISNEGSCSESIWNSTNQLAAHFPKLKIAMVKDFHSSGMDPSDLIKTCDEYQCSLIFLNARTNDVQSLVDAASTLKAYQHIASCDQTQTDFTTELNIHHIAYQKHFVHTTPSRVGISLGRNS